SSCYLHDLLIYRRRNRVAVRFQAFDIKFDGLFCVRQCFLSGRTLRNAAGKRRNFCDEDPVFIGFYRYTVLHIFTNSLSSTPISATNSTSFGVPSSSNCSSGASKRFSGFGLPCASRWNCGVLLVIVVRRKSLCPIGNIVSSFSPPSGMPATSAFRSGTCAFSFTP